jgi:Ala-tRNA(Pro) deacylase
MIPDRISQYLSNARVPFALRTHERVIPAQRLAASLHVSGKRVAKTVLVEAGGDAWIAVLPADERIDWTKLGKALGSPLVRKLDEAEFSRYFPEVEVGAEPPFGRLFRVPMVVDSSLAKATWLVFRGGTHVDTIEMAFPDFQRLESPLIASFAVPEHEGVEAHA